MGLLVNEHEKEIVSLPRKMGPEQRVSTGKRSSPHPALLGSLGFGIIGQLLQFRQTRSWSSGLDRGFVYWMLCF